MTFSGVGSSVQWENSRVTPNIYDVFINHQGEVKEKLVRPLHKSLEEKGIPVFLDSAALKTGDHFPAALEQAINSSVVQIAIFSEQYCGSHWCLDELVFMLQTKAMIIPVFYDVKPSDLRYIKGKTEGAEKETGGQKEPRVYDEAFTKHEKRESDAKVQRWKEALDHVSKIHGEERCKHNDDNSLLETIVSAVVKEVERRRITKLDGAKPLVGVDDLVKDFERFRSQTKNRVDKVEIVGIYGPGGSGKTTLARELYNRKQSEYDGFCFLHDVADGKLPFYQSRLLKDLVGEDRHEFYSTDQGMSCLKNRLGRSCLLRFLLVLDDVSNPNQLDVLLIRDALSPASLVIVTTSDERVLKQANIQNRYKVKEMTYSQQVELFCLSAFNRPDPPMEFKDRVDKFVSYCGGSPLFLQLIVRLVSGGDGKYWDITLDAIKDSVPEDLHKILKISYDRLGKEEQQIFIDIACFFSGKPRCTALKIWKGCKWRGEFALERLKDKCLVEEVCLDWYQYESDDKLSLRMHDRIRDFGRQLAKELTHPGRLWLPEHHTSQKFQEILSRSSRSFHSIYDRSMGSQITYFLGNTDYTSESVLLWLELDLDGFEQTRLPTWISLKKLQCLRISFSQLERLWLNREEAPLQLTELVLHESSLAECTNRLGDLNHLEKLVLIGRNEERPIEAEFLSECLNKLTKLRSLVLRYFALNGDLALNMGNGMSSLETMEVRGIKLVSKVSISGKHCPKLKYLCLDSMDNLIEVDLSLTILNFLELRRCKNLKRVLGNFGLPELVMLNVLECWELQEFPSLASLSCVESISIDGCRKLENVSGIGDLQRLKYLHLSAFGEGALRNCIHRLQRLPKEMISVIGKANLKAKLAVHADQFFSLIEVSENPGIRINKNIMMLEDPAVPFSAIILCAVVRAPYGEESNTISIPHASAVIKSSVGGGEWMVTVVVTGQTKLRYGEFPIVALGTIVKKRWIMTLKVGAEGRTLGLLQRIIDEFYGSVN
ncbi:hypothetical protein SUGI_0672270 [Cryptomeria japonica]|nr:hypothetical protein SUGI_0672270 [Cryptomeria japonica]